MYSFLPGGNRRFWVVTTHMALWVAYTSFIYIANKLSDKNVTVLYTITSMLPYVLVVYISIYWLNRYRQIGPVLGTLTFIGTFVVLTGLSYYYIYHFLPGTGMLVYNNEQFREFFKYALLGYLQYYSYALLYFVIKVFFKKERSLRLLQEEKFIKEIENAKLKETELQAQQEKLRMEYAFLKAQVNPHFLHNTLNMLYEEASNYSEVLAANISRLSNMMRYSFENLDAGNDLVSIQKEMKNLERLIEIHDNRHQKEDMVKLEIKGAMENQLVPPLSLITILENAFKYGDLSDIANPLLVRLSLQPGFIHFYCRNKIRQRSDYNSSHKTGLANLRRRLEVILPGRYLLQDTRQEQFYITELTIKS